MPTATTTTTLTRPKLTDIPLAPGVDLATLKDKDDSEVLVELKPVAGFTDADAKKLVDAIAARTLNSFRGHVPANDRGNAFKDVVASWIGAAIVDGIAYVRGVIHDPEVARWVASGRLDLDAVVESNGYLALDFMSLDRGQHAGQVIQPGSVTTERGKAADTTTGGTEANTTGEMKPMARTHDGQDIPALPRRQRTYADSVRQVIEGPPTVAQQPAAASTVGLPSRRRSI